MGCAVGQLVVHVLTRKLLLSEQAAQKSPAVTCPWHLGVALPWVTLSGTEMTSQLRKPRRLFSERAGWKHLTEVAG